MRSSVRAALLALVWSAVMPLPLSAAGAAAPSAAEAEAAWRWLSTVAMPTI